MASISLREYNHEIEGMINAGQVDEAIAHCMHILQSVPKHIATYRLLGKALLEVQRYADAADIFQRVLSSMPDDFVAHIGMSMIREDERNLDAAIWHMERAFEIQPASPPIQEELRRLYGRRDGVAPQKIRLTRGALARMYARGNLYDQAIAELRAALAEDPQRLDLQVILAQMYSRTDQRMEAVQTCSSLIRKIPYCLEASRILAVILPDTERSADTQGYMQRVVSMDPYYAHVPPNTLTSDQAPDQAVAVEKLTYRPGEQLLGAASKPGWATSLGAAFEPTEEVGLPDWLAGEGEGQPLTSDEFTFDEEGGLPGWLGETPSTPETAAPTPILEAEPGEDQIPDFLKSAGWQYSEGGVEEPPPSMDFALEEETIPETGEPVQADIPDWLRDIAPEGALDTGVETGVEKVEDLPPWLQETFPGPTDSVVTWLEETQGEGAPPEDLTGLEEALRQPSQKKTGEDLPDWLSGLQSTEEVEMEPAAPAEGLPDWLAELEPESAEAPQAEVEPGLADQFEVPDWLTAEEQPTMVAGLQPAELEEVAEPAEAIPDWLAEAEAEGAEIETPVSGITPVEEEAAAPEFAEAEAAPAVPDFADEDAALAWLESLAERQGAPQDQLTTRPEERPTELPGWLIEEEEAPVAEVPSEAEAVELGPTEAEPAQVIPAWLVEAEAEGVEIETPVSGIAPVEVEAAAPEFAEAEAAPAGLDFADEDAALAWLESLAERQGAPQDQLTTRPEERPTELPGWLIEEEEAPVAEVPSEAEAVELGPTEAEPAQVIPAWLVEAEAEGVEIETPVSGIAPVEVEAAAPEFAEAEAAPAGLDFADEDAALAWLESLAERQGAPQDQLTTRPEERPTELPGWLIEEEEAPVAEVPSEVEAVELGPTEAEPAQVIPAWLVEAEAEGEPEWVEPPAAKPEWLTEIEAEVDAMEAREAAAQAEAPTPIPGLAEGMELVDEDAALAWMESLAQKHGVPEDQLTTSPEERPTEMPVWLRDEVLRSETEEGEAIPAWDQAQEEIPAWIAAPVDEEETPVQKPAWTLEQEPAFAEELPGQKMDLNAASLVDMEDLPGMGFIFAQSIIEYREQHGSFSSLRELGQVPGFTPDMVEALKPYLMVHTAPLKPIFADRPLQPRSEDEAQLMTARSAVVSGEITSAMDEYTRLLKKSLFVEEIIWDLRETLQRHPQQLLLWQTLGDAYLRNNQLQDAVDAYTEAEKLLR